MGITLKHVNFRPFLCQKYFLNKNKWFKSCIYKKYTDKNSNKSGTNFEPLCTNLFFLKI